MISQKDKMLCFLIGFYNELVRCNNNLIDTTVDRGVYEYDDNCDAIDFCIQSMKKILQGIKEQIKEFDEDEYFDMSDEEIADFVANIWNNKIVKCRKKTANKQEYGENQDIIDTYFETTNAILRKLNRTTDKLCNGVPDEAGDTYIDDLYGSESSGSESSTIDEVPDNDEDFEFSDLPFDDDSDTDIPFDDDLPVDD